MAEKVPHVTPVTATTINGITYFKLKPDPENPRYRGDYTKNCGLLGNEIDENFFYLRNVYIYTAYTQTIDGVRNLVLERVNGDKIYVDLSDESSYVVDDEGHIIVDGHPIKDENGEPVSFLIKGRDVHIVTDASTQGDGSYGKPIGVDLAYRTGTYSPADFFVDLTCDDVTLRDFTNIGYGHSIVTRENVGRFGALYTFTQAQKLNAALKRLYGEKGWRVPSKEDWAKLLNWAEGCDGIQNHNTADSGNFGKFAGQRLKSVGFWNYDTEDKKPVDEFGFGVYPVGICPNDYNVAQPHSEFNFTGLYDVTSFWEADMSHNEGYIRKFSYGHNTVKQETNDIKNRNSIRLVRDIDGDFDVTAFADILGNYLPVILTTDGKQLWTLFNVGITNYDGFDEREVTIPKEWEDINTNVPATTFYQLDKIGDSYAYVEIEEYMIPSTAIVKTVTEIPEPESGSPDYIRYEYLIHIDMSTEPKFYYNAWDGNMWNKKQIMVGESVVLLSEDYPTTCVTATTYVTSANTNHEWRVYFNEQTGLDELIDTLEALKEEFAEEFYKLNEKIDDLSATTEEFSAATVEEIARLDERIDDEEARAISAETELHERIDSLEIASAETPDETVFASYILREGPDGEQKGVRIDIPKDKSIKDISLGWSGATVDEETGEYTYRPESGETEVLDIVYHNEDGKYQLVEIDLEQFLNEKEFKDGLEVDNHEVKVKIDPASDWFLTVSMSGVSLQGVDAALDNIVLDVIGGEGSSESGYSIDFYEGEWSEVSQEECDSHPHTVVGELPDAKTWSGTTYVEVFDGINHSYYKRVSGTNYISDSETILDALNTLDATLKDESDRAQAAEKALDEKIEAETERAMSAETALDEKIEAETERAMSAETVLHEEIVAETERAISAETALHEEIVAETERAISAETVLHEEIVAETERAISAETELHEEILEEASARTEADEYLQEQIDELKAKTIDPADDSIVIEVSGSSTTIRVQISETEKQLKLSDGTAVEYYDSAGHPIYIPKGLYIDQDFGEFEG